MKKIADYWYSESPILYFLLPFSYLYRLGFYCHKLLYQLGIKKKYKANVPVIIVGNITVGGTGKTPLVIGLAQFLQKQGYRPGIVSRGYKGEASSFPQRVFPESNPKLVGDEPVLIARNTSCPVAVAPRRASAITMIMSTTDCNIIIADDGLQHHALARDIEIAIVDGERRHGNGFCLPAGPLRETIKTLSRVDFVIEHHYPGQGEGSAFNMTLGCKKMVNLIDKTILPLPFKQDRTIHAVAGIGNPKQFFQMLRCLGLQIVEHSFPDHHSYHQKDFDFCLANEMIIMTEKDAVKCQPIAKSNYWALPVSCQLSPPFLEQLLQRLNSNSG